MLAARSAVLDPHPGLTRLTNFSAGRASVMGFGNLRPKITTAAASATSTRAPPRMCYEFLRAPEDTDAIERGLAGYVEVWLRRTWDAESALTPLLTAICGNALPLCRCRNHGVGRAGVVL
jgi:hypothetical protein